MRTPSRPLSFPTAALLLGAVLAAPRALGADDGGKTAPGPAPKEFAVAPGDDATLTEAAELHASKGTSWSEGGAQYLLLEGGDVAFRLGAYGFSANRALVRIVSEKQGEATFRHLTLYLENARDLGGNTVAAEAPRLVVTATTTGKVSVAAPLLAKAQAAPADAPGDDFVAKGMLRVAPRAAAPAASAAAPSAALPAAPPPKDKRRADRDARRKELEASRLETMKAPDAGAGSRPGAETADQEDDGAPSLPGLPSAKDGKAAGPIHCFADRLEFVRGKDGREDTGLLMGHVRLSWDYGGQPVEVQAENAVIFLKGSGGDAFDASDASKIAGIYLEDNAIIAYGEPAAGGLADGKTGPLAGNAAGTHVVRAPRIWFDAVHRRATLLDAVMYAVDTKVKVPLYMRARLLRENAGDALEARGVVVANNGFAEPMVALGANRLTVSKTPADPAASGSKERALVTASGVAPEVEGVPFLWLPYAALPGWNIPLRSIYGGYSSSDGPNVRTKWGVYELLDLKRPKNEDLTADLDWRGRHGGALGGDYTYHRDDSFGRWRGYVMPDDKGTDYIPGRDNIVHDGDTRDFVRIDHRHYLTPETELTLHGAKQSDPTVQEAFFQDYTERPPETGASLKHAHADWAVSGTVSYQLDDFTPSLAELQSRGFQTERTEAEFRRIATELLDGRANWYSENRVGRVRAAVGRDAPDTRGIADWASIPEFGIASATPFRSAAQVAGVPTTWVNRLDSRQELDVPLQSGPVDVTPYAVVRYTQWSDSVAQPGGAEDSRRLYGGGGVRFATELTGTTVDWRSEWLDVSGLRHVVRPELDLGWFGSSMASGSLPMYDPDVEGLGEGAFARFGVANAWQTRRGEEGNRHLVDWIRFKQDLVLRRGEEDPQRVIPRFVDWRPDYALGGSHTRSEFLWQATNALAVNADATYVLDSGKVEQWGAAGDYTHSDRLSTRLGYLETRMYEEKLVSYGVHYRLTSKYDLAVNQTLDLGPAQTGWLSASLDRKMPGGLLRFIGTYDELNSSYAVGVAFSPQGFTGTGIGHSLYQRQPR